MPKLKTPIEYSIILEIEFWVFKIDPDPPKTFSVTLVGFINCTPINDPIVTNPPAIMAATGFIITIGRFMPTKAPPRAPAIERAVVL